jgi:hypothetical protein
MLSGVMRQGLNRINRFFAVFQKCASLAKRGFGNHRTITFALLLLLLLFISLPKLGGAKLRRAWKGPNHPKEILRIQVEGLKEGAEGFPHVRSDEAEVK